MHDFQAIESSVKSEPSRYEAYEQLRCHLSPPCLSWFTLQGEKGQSIVSELLAKCLEGNSLDYS